MSLRDLINEFEAEIASLLSRFRSHPAVVAEAVAQPTADPPADFGPVSPDGSAPPNAPPMEPPAPPAVQPDVPRPENTTDAAAPGFHSPAQPAPAPAPAPVESGLDPYASVIDWNATGGGSSYNYKLHSSGSKTFTVPEGYVGFFTLSVGDTPESAGSAGYDVTLNGAHPYHAANGNNEVTHIVYVGIVPPADNNPRNVIGGTGPYTYSVSCQGGAVVALRHYP